MQPNEHLFVIAYSSFLDVLQDQTFNTRSFFFFTETYAFKKLACVAYKQSVEFRAFSTGS